LGKDARPLGRVVSGNGNNGEDHFEGYWQGNLIGTYLHGSLLPKNPWLSDWMLSQSLLRRYGQVDLASLDDHIEELAHEKAKSLCRS
jgi:CobQ-like glutamine amidotransferase family enzyme